MQHHPPARPTADHAARRAGGRCRGRGRIGGRECGIWSQPRGSLIRHATAAAIGALVVAMIQPAFGARLMAGPGGPDAARAGGAPTGGRAIGVASVAGRADREQAVAGTTGLLAEGCVHGTAADDRRCHWTPVPFRGTTEGDCLGPMEPEVVTGARRISPDPHLITVASAYLSCSRTRTHARCSSSGGRAPFQRGAPRPLRGRSACPSRDPESKAGTGSLIEKDSDFCGST